MRHMTEGAVTEDRLRNLRHDLMELEDAIEDLPSFKTSVHGGLAEIRRRMADLELQLSARGGDPEQLKELNAWRHFTRFGEVLDGLRTATIGNTASGPDLGYGVPTYIAKLIQQKLLQYSPVRALARVEDAGSENFSVPVSVNDTAAAWTTEEGVRNGTSTGKLASCAPVFGELYSLQSATTRLLQDVAFNLDEWMADQAARAFAPLEDQAFLNGTATNGQPKGLLTYTIKASPAFGEINRIATGASAGFPSTAPADCLIKAVKSVRAGYRKNGSWLMHPDTLEQIRDMKDSSGRYIFSFTEGLEALLALGRVVPGCSGVLLGHPVYEDESMPAPGASANAILFGDFRSGFLIADIKAVEQLRDRVTDKGRVQFLTTKRVGSALLDSTALVCVVQAAT